MTTKERAINYMRLKKGYKENKNMRDKIERWIIRLSNWIKESKQL